jgi:hypothetical protein
LCNCLLIDLRDILSRIVVVVAAARALRLLAEKYSN